jgi:putative ABC transport system substrate-binding protein
MRVRRLLWFLATCLPLLVASSQPATPAAPADVAVLMSANVDAYRDALKGFRSSLRHRIAAEYDMGGDLKAGRKALAEMRSKVKPDLILAVGVWALQVLAEESPDVPVVYAMVLNPPSVIGDGKRNITGASMNVPVKSTMELVRKLGPQIRRVGVVYSPAKTGYLMRRAEAAAREEGLQLSAREIGSPREAIAAVEALQESGIDALWIPPDETILAPEVIQHILLLSYAKKLPVIGLSERQAQLGAILSLQFGSSEDIGRQAAELANSILDGRAASELPYTTVRQVNVTVNLRAAQKLGLVVPQSVVAAANTVIQ